MEEEVFKSFDPLIASIAKNFYGIEFDDLMQAGRLGLHNAYKHYDKKENTKFSSFAYSYIFGEMYNLSLKNNVIKQSRDTLKLRKLVEKARQFLTQKLDKVPSNLEIAKYLELDEEVVDNIILSSNVILSLDSEEDNTLYNLVGNQEDNDMKIDIKAGIETLSKDEQDIIKYRYYNDLTQSETAKLLGMSQVKVSRYEQKSLNKLQKIMSM